MKAQKSILIVLLLVASLGISSCGKSSSSTSPKVGEWKATAEFGEFVFVINSDGATIEKVDFNFTSLKCDGMTHSGGVGLTYSEGHKIEKSAFMLDYESSDPLSGQKEILTITGKFSSSGDTASGTWEDKLEGVVCASGNWTAAPNKNTP